VADDPNANRTVDVWVACGSHKPLEDADLHGFVVNQDLSQPDMAMLTVKNEGHEFSNGTKHGDEVEVKIGGESGTSIFKGEVVGVEPIYKSGGESKCIIRAFNRMHRLRRGKKSKTFQKMSDQDIASSIAQEAGLQASTGSKPSITHEHVYQHNQTDLDFLLLRAKRIGFDVWCEDKKLYFDKPDTSKDSGIELKMKDPEAGFMMTSFHPRISSARMAEKVVVRGWNPEKKEEIVGEAKAKKSSLGKKGGEAASKSAFGATTTYEVDHPIFSVEEAKAIAEARLDELRMSYITGDAQVVGDKQCDLKPGIVVKVTINTDDPKDRFNGKYLVVGATHRYTHAGGGGSGRGGGGYTTSLLLNRDSEGGS
jgi:phage protein D